MAISAGRTCAKQWPGCAWLRDDRGFGRRFVVFYAKAIAKSVQKAKKLFARKKPYRLFR